MLLLCTGFLKAVCDTLQLLVPTLPAEWDHLHSAGLFKRETGHVTVRKGTVIPQIPKTSNRKLHSDLKIISLLLI